MALGDVLAARANAARATARIACGSLGEVTLEALPVRELEQLSRGGDAERAIFYAACRDLQRAGAELMRQGRLYRPDQVTALVSADEAGIAAQTVRELSGYQGGQDAHESAKKRSASADAGNEAKEILSFPKKKVSLWTPERKGSGADLKDGAVDDRGAGVRDDTFSEGDRWRYSVGERSASKENEAATPSAGAGAAVDEGDVKEGGQVSHESDLPEVRPEVVQEDAEVRHDTVQQDLTENTEIRHSFVQDGGEESGDGQVSHEFLTESAGEIAKPDGKQVLWSETAQTPQNVVKMDKTDSSLRNNEPSAEEKQNARKRKKANRAHESKSEIEAARSGVLHENKSELTPGDVRLMHEITSEIAEAMHENKSEFRENVHESKSEKAEILHEDKSELAERVARELLEGLRRAAWVR